MGLLSDFLSLFQPMSAPIETRVAAPFEVNIPALFGRHEWGPWRSPSIREALGVPAILRCVTLIANTVGVLSMDAFRNGVKMDERPRLVVRPNPLTTPRVFYRDTAFHLATRGESWWWVAARDLDDAVLSVVPVPPWEVKVEEDPRDPRFPTIRWRNRVMPNRDMRHLTLLPDPDHPSRGAGPLQLCGAAISVAVESQEWAANFYAEGGYPSISLLSDVEFADEDEPAKIKEKWTSNPPNTPHVLSPGLKPDYPPGNESAAQMLASREFQVGEVARKFGIPGSLLDHFVSGSSLTYQNVGDEFDKFVRSCLWPNYLEPIEQEMSDLLSRSTVGRFDLKALLRPNPKTRAEIYEKLVPIGIQTVEEARVDEGYDPGSIETAPMPVSPPAAMPPVLELRTAPAASDTPKPTTVLARLAMSKGEIRCDGLNRSRDSSGVFQVKACNRLLSRTGSFAGQCPRCKKEYAAAVVA